MRRRPDPPGTVIHSDARLLRHWESLMGRGGFGRRSLWLVFLDADDRTLPVVMPIDDVPLRPEENIATNLMGIVAELAGEDPGLGVAILLSRPGPSGMTDHDRDWAALLVRLARDLGVRMWPVHLATADRVQVFAPDDLVGVAV